MIQVKNLTKSFLTSQGPRQVVSDVSFEVEPGEILAFLGPNGAGKSTTMKMMTGFLNADAGSVRFGTLDIVSDRLNCQKHIGYVPENAPLYQDMTVIGFLNFCAEVRGLKNDQKKERVQEAIKLCKLQKVEDERIETLSKGFKRRVSIAQALVHDPQFLILDEPTDGLDPNQKRDVRELLRDLAAKNKTIIVSTHILEEVEELCTKVVLIAEGKVKFHGPVDKFKEIDPVLSQVFHRLTQQVAEVMHA